MKWLLGIASVVLLAVVFVGCRSSPPNIPFATGWSGTMTDQNSNVYGVSFGTQSDTWAMVTTGGTYAVGTSLNVNTNYPNATVKMIDSVGDWVQLSGTYSAKKFTGSWTSDVGVHGAFTVSVDASVQSLSLGSNAVTLSRLVK